MKSVTSFNSICPVPQKNLVMLIFLGLLIFVQISCNLLAPKMPGLTPNSFISSENANKLIQVDRYGVGEINDISVSRDGKNIAMGCSTGILILDSEYLTDIRFLGTDVIVDSVVFSPDGTLLASKMDDGSIKLWRVEDGSYLYSVQGTEFWSDTNIMFSPDGRYIASSGVTEDQEYGIYFWNVFDGSIAKIFPVEYQNLTSIDFSPDGALIASGGDNGNVTVWNVNSGLIIQKFPVYWFNVESRLFYIRFMPDGKRIVAGNGEYPRYTVWDVSSGTQIENIPEHTFTNVFFPPDVPLMYFIDTNGINIWNTQTGEFLDTSGWNFDSATNIALYPDGTRLVLVKSVIGSQNIEVEIIQTSDGDVLKSREFDYYIVDHLAFLSDGTLISVGLDKLNCSLIIGRFLNESATLQNITNENNGECANNVVVSSNGITAASTTENGTVTIKTLSDNNNPITINNENRSILSLALSPDGKILATGEYDNNTSTYIVNIRYTTDGTVKKSLEGFTNMIVGLAFSPDGSVLATVTADGFVKLWNTANSSLLSTANLGSEGISLLSDWALISYPSDEYLAFSEEKKVLLWDIRENRFQYTLDPETYYSSALFVGFSPDNKLIAVGDRDGTITIWSVDEGAKLIVLKGHTAGINSVIFSPDGSELTSGSDDGTILVWGIQP